MSDSEPSESSQQERLVRIETALAHLQHDVEDLNQALTYYFGRLLMFDERFSRIEHDIERLHEGPEQSDAEQEKPPHY